MSIQLARVNLAMRKPAGTPWPKTFTEKQIAYFATWRGDEPDPNWSARAAPLHHALHIACERGELDHTTTTERVLAPITRPRLMNTGKPRPTVEIALHHIAAAPVARWLEAQDVQPGELLQAWFKARGVGVAAVEVAPPAPAVESADEREDRRLQMCIDAGLKMDKEAIRRLPDGVGDIAKLEGVSRQTFSDDVRRALRRKHPETRPQLKAV